MLALIILLPFLNSFSCLFFGYLFGKNGAKRITLLFIYLYMLLSFTVFLFCLRGESFYLDFGPWFHFSSTVVDWLFSFDLVAGIMLLVVSLVSLFVHYYSFEYMNNDPHLPRFLGYLSLFTGFMTLLVTSSNLLVMFIGWEGVGLCSYLLISFWTTRIVATKAALKAILVNRIGDFFFLYATSLCHFLFGTIDFTLMAALVPYYYNCEFLIFESFYVSVITVIGTCFVIAAAGKSAQLGLHTWLPDAMEGPTPVSALIHAATMVTAGVFLLIRISFLLEYSVFVLNFIVVLGLATSLFSALIANFQVDLKKIIAYSTCSQLGFMFTACGLSSYTVAFYHLFNHAFFKALLFLCAGSIIHALLGSEQDIRKMGYLTFYLPLTTAGFDIGLACLVAFPFMGGFYSKDLILEIGGCSTGFLSIVYYLGVIGALLTAGYCDLIEDAYSNSEEIYSYKLLHISVVESEHEIATILGYLSFLSITSGYFFVNIFDSGSALFNLIYVNPHNYYWFSQKDFIPYYLQIMPLCLIIFFSLYFWSCDIFLFGLDKKNNLHFFENSLVNKFSFDAFIFRCGVVPFFKLFKLVYLVLDRGFLEIIGPTGIYSSLSSTYLNRYHSGFFYHYASGAIFIFIFFFSCFIIIV